MYELGVRALIKDKDGKILLVRNIGGIHSSKWVLPGGKVEKGELAVNAIKREVLEELQLDLEPEFYTYKEDLRSSEEKYYLIFFFDGKSVGNVKFQESELYEFSYFGLKEIESLDLGYPHKDVVVEYLQK